MLIKKMFLTLLALNLLLFSNTKETLLSLSYPIRFITSEENYNDYNGILDFSINLNIFFVEDKAFFTNSLAYMFEGAKHGYVGSIHIAYPRVGLGICYLVNDKHSFRYSFLIGSMFAFSNPEFEVTLSGSNRAEFLFHLNDKFMLGPFCDLTLSKRFKDYMPIQSDLNFFKMGVIIGF